MKFQKNYFTSSLCKINLGKGYLYMCICMDFHITLHINNSIYTNYENISIELDSEV